MTKEEYKQSILENARLRRMAAEQEQVSLPRHPHVQSIKDLFCKAEALEKEAAAAAAADQPAEDSEELKEAGESEESEEESEDAVEMSMSEDSEEEAEEEEDIFTEKELFMHMLQDDDEQQREPKPRRYVPFVPSEDDDEYGAPIPA